MSTAKHGWLFPRCETRTGAAHRRRGSPCQDASGLLSFTDADGDWLHALVVSDGHGGSRYDRSDVGSRLACWATLVELQTQLSGRRLQRSTDLEEWRSWLAEALPASVLKRWRQEVLTHAEAHPRADGAAPSTLPYGATLGVLLLTPRWWGHTGLGDWDLVRIGSSGRGELLSEEPDMPGGGEATFSLCMQQAEGHFASRSGVLPITAGQDPFRLLLSSDGIRKSCGSDADFLTLARHLSELPESPQRSETSGLAEALDHISSQGSGDDVSVAIAAWRGLQGSPQGQAGPQRQRASTPLIVQPRPEASTNGPAGLNGAIELPAGRSDETPGARQGALEGDWRAERRSPSAWGSGWMAILALAVSATAAMALLSWGPFSRRSLAPVEPALATVLQEEMARLCDPPLPASRQAAGSGSPPAPSGGRSGQQPPATAAAAAETSPAADKEQRDRITATLDQRRRLFLDLQRQRERPDTFLSQPQQDPTGALIAWSQSHPDLKPLGSASDERSSPMNRLIKLLQPTLEPDRVAQQPQQTTVACPELLHALRLQWQRARTEAGAGAAGTGGPPAGRSGEQAPSGTDPAGSGRPARAIAPVQPEESPSR